MKKTIIAMLALAGAANADYTAEQFNAWLSEALGERGGNKYTLTFTLSDTYNFGGSQNLFTLKTLEGTDTWSIRQQQGWYLGFTTGSDCGSASYASRNDSTVSYIDTDTAANGDGMYQGWFHEGSIAGATITIFSEGNSTEITFVSAGDNPHKVTFERSLFYQPNDNYGGELIEGYGAVDTKLANASYIKSAAIYYNEDKSTISTIPEPTTATLSLLALAGLAARRRRK